MFVESESKRIGRLQVPDALLDAMRAAPCVRVDLPTASRVALLKEEYAHFLADPDAARATARAALPLHGKATIERWNAQAQSGAFDALVDSLLVEHYDPTYARAIERNFPNFPRALVAAPEGIDAEAFRRAARALRQRARQENGMSDYAFRIVNVFAESRLAGNPLCVFEDASGLDEATMQALALQFNLSETTFVLPSERATARVRIFTPTFEMPFAGHPTLGTAHVVRSLRGGGDRVTLEMKAGVIPVEADGDVWTLEANAPKHREPAAARDELAAMLGIAADEILERPLWIDTGSDQLVIPLATRDAVRRVAPKPDLMLRIAAQRSARDGLCFRARQGQRALPLLLPASTAR